jgi:uncharacterized protein (TIGR01244 family)
MADIRPVTDDFSVAPQIAPADLADLAGQGYRLVINNRPDHEVPGQPTSAEMEAAARAAGLDYRHIPVFGGPGPAEVAAMREAIEQAAGPALAFCRSGTRSIVTWSLGRLTAGEPRDGLVQSARAAGYDLSSVLP